MALTYQNAQDIVQKCLGDSSDDEFVQHCLNHAQREVARAKWWPELMVRDFFNTEAAYETGTVSITTNTTTVTLVGGVWPANIETYKWRFAVSPTDPWYEVATRTNDTAMELADAFVDDTIATSDFIVYRTHYALAAAVDQVRGIWLHDAGHANQMVNAETDQKVSDFLHYPSGPGTPTHYLHVERDSTGKKQVVLGPEAPDDVYRVEYVYKKKVTDGTFNGNLDESRWPVVLARAKALAYEPEHYERSVAEYQKYAVLLEREWGDSSDGKNRGLMLGQTRVMHPGRDGYYETLLGRGRINYPS